MQEYAGLVHSPCSAPRAGAATDKFYEIYPRFIAELRRILSGVIANFIAGVWLDYRRIIGELWRDLWRDYQNIIAELLQRCNNFGACRDRTRTRDKLESCFGSSESNSCQLEKVSRPGIEPVTASGSNSQAPKSCLDRESNSAHMEMCSQTGFMARVAIIFR